MMLEPPQKIMTLFDIRSPPSETLKKRRNFKILQGDGFGSHLSRLRLPRKNHIPESNWAQNNQFVIQHAGAAAQKAQHFPRNNASVTSTSISVQSDCDQFD